ncbi:MAG: hypothetical protein WBH40_10830 [Ignavibacteriaceae bacterium]
MMKKLALFISILLFIFFTGCDKSGKDDANQETSPDVTNNNGSDDEQADKNKNGDNDDFTENMKKLEDMMSGGEEVEVVNFRKLKELLPEELDEMKRTGSSGEKTNAFGINVSKAEGEYKSEDNKQKIKITILDMGSMKGLAGMTAFAWSWAEIDKESDDGFERTFEYKGHKAYEKYNTNYQDGEVQVLVAKRFMVEIKGSDTPMEKMHSALDEVNIGDLESMKDEGKKEE